MEVNKEIQSRAINTVFGYKKIVWEIVNYLPWTSTNGFIIRSPEFSIQGPHLTKWQLCLALKLIRGRYTATMKLERQECDSFIKDVKVKWKLCFPLGKGLEAVIESAKTFKAKQGFESEIDDILDIERVLLTGEKSDVFVVTCFMIVYIEDDSKTLERSNDSGLKSLSQDLLALLRAHRYTDAILRTDGSGIIYMHKAIACCRNSTFNSLIKKDIIDGFILRADLDTAKMMISFLYTGDLKYVLRLPSFSIENAVEYLNIDELKQYYSPVGLTLKTEMISTETKFIWTVVYPNDYRCIWSHRMSAIEKDTICRVALYPRGFSGTKDYMSLKIQFRKETRVERMCIYVGVLDVYNKSAYLKIIRTLLGSDSTFASTVVLERFVFRNNVNDPLYTAKGRLKLFCKFIKFRLQINVPVAETCLVATINKDTHYDKLSKDISSLYETSDYSDYIIECGIFRFKVHKIIISCRSHVLGSMIESAGNDLSLSIPDVEPDILNIIIYYMYSGILKPCEIHKILKIYDAAKRFGMLPLKNTCSRILEENLDIKNAVEILTAAYEHKDLKLKSAALKFIFCNINDIQTQECWQVLKNKHPSLCT